MRHLGLRVVCGLLSLQRLHSRVALFGRCCCLLPVFVCVWCAIVRGIRGLHLCSYCFALRRLCASNQLISVASLGRCSGWFVVVTHLPWAVKSRRSACESRTAWCCWYFSHARSTSGRSVIVMSRTCEGLLCCRHLLPIATRVARYVDCLCRLFQTSFQTRESGQLHCCSIVLFPIRYF